MTGPVDATPAAASDPVTDPPADYVDPTDDDVDPAADSTADVVTPNPEKDPSDWVTGDEPMTGPQTSYLHTLAQEAGREVPDGLSKAAASRLIDELQHETGRGPTD